MFWAFQMSWPDLKTLLSICLQDRALSQAHGAQTFICFTTSSQHGETFFFKSLLLKHQRPNYGKKGKGETPYIKLHGTGCGIVWVVCVVLCVVCMRFFAEELELYLVLTTTTFHIFVISEKENSRK